MNELRKTAEIVREILTEEPETRSDDMLLYYMVCRKMNPQFISIPFGVAILTMKEHGVAPFETVRRTRQKMQQSYPELAANSTVEAFREMKEEEFREYAREVF